MRFVEDLRVERGDILIAGAGQIGPATLFGRSLVADSRLAGKLAAGDLMVLRGGGSDDDNLLYLAAFLRSEVGVAAVRSCAYGTSIPRMRPDLLAQLPVPLPDSDQKRRIAALMRTTVEQREQYALSLKAARRVIEDLPEMRYVRRPSCEVHHLERRFANDQRVDLRLDRRCVWSAAEAVVGAPRRSRASCWHLSR